MAGHEEDGIQCLWGNKAYADLVVTFRRAHDESCPNKKPRLSCSKQLLLHAPLLIRSSPVLKARLLRWTPLNEGDRATLDWIADTEEEEQGAEDMLYAIYHNALPSGCSTLAPIIHCFECAEKYQVEQVMRIVTDRLSDRGGDGDPVTYDDAITFFRRPSAITTLLSAFKPAARQALKELSDLDVAMNDCKLQEKLMALPEEALAALLDVARCFNESTVAAVAIAWAHAQGLLDIPDVIASRIKMISLKPEFIAAIFSYVSPWWNAQNIAMLCAIQSSGLWMLPGSRDVKIAGGAVLTLQMRPGARPKSSLEEVVFENTVSRRALTEAKQEALDTGKDVVVQMLHANRAMFIAGLWWGVELEWSAQRGSWGIYIHPQGGDAIASRVGATKTYHKAFVTLEVPRPGNPLWLQTTRAWALGVRKMGFSNNVGIDPWLDATGHMTFTLTIAPVQR